MDLSCRKTLLILMSLAVLVAVESAKLHDRIVRGEKLSEKEHFHGDGHDHDADYDHEAFLGRDEAHEFDQLSPGKSNKFKENPHGVPSLPGGDNSPGLKAGTLWLYHFYVGS